jgi:hypothetical protein
MIFEELIHHLSRLLSANPENIFCLEELILNLYSNDVKEPFFYFYIGPNYYQRIITDLHKIKHYRVHLNDRDKSRQNN